MKRKEILNQIKNKNMADLKKDLADYRDRLWSLKKDLVAGKVKNVKEIKEIKKAIARIMTMRNSKA
ncbi:MAG TPA: 50S ribosomal protein L29 [Candidatus Paceibacterota bacterium]